MSGTQPLNTSIYDIGRGPHLPQLFEGQGHNSQFFKGRFREVVDAGGL